MHAKEAPMRRKDAMQELETNAQSILLRYRALNHKAAELRNMVVLPIKRDHKVFDSCNVQITGLTSSQVSELVSLLLQYISSLP